MIKKIVAIKHVGKFRSCCAKDDVEFCKLTLIYGENGYGKTTLAEIFRSLQSGDPHLVIGRTTLGSSQSPEITVRLDGQTASFKAGTWDASCTEISVFDTRFVHDNVFAGDYVDHDHKRNLYRLIVGQQGVTLAHHVDELDQGIRDVTKDITAKEKAISPNIPQGMKLDTFVALPNHDDLDHRIVEKEAEVKALKSASDIAAKTKLHEVKCPALPPEFVALLGKTLDDVASDVEHRIREHLTTHTNKATQTWIAQGLDFVRDERCPFCDQPLAASHIIPVFRPFFSKSYGALKAEITATDTAIATAFGEHALLAVQKVIVDNNALLQFWGQFAPIDSAPLSATIDLSPWPSLRDTAREDLAGKKAAPLEPVFPSPAFQESLAKYGCLVARVAQHNEGVRAANLLIDQRKTATKVSSLSKEASALQSLRASKTRHEPAVANSCDVYQRLLQDKKALETEKRRAKKDLDEFTEQVFAKYQRRINELLAMFGADFQIANTKGQYLGGKTSSTYQILINETPVDLGDPGTPVHTPSFRNTLSAGDRTTLALAFFLAQMEQDPDLENKIVIFDDPYGSQDESRRTCTQQLIGRIFRAAKQVVVLSHEPSFLRLVADALPSATRKTLQLCFFGGTMTVTPWDIADATANEFTKQHTILTKYIVDRDGEPRLVVKTIRPVLEGHLRRKFPGQFLPNEWAGDMIEKIRNADANSPLSIAQPDLPELEAVNDYSKKHHHDQVVPVPLNEGELLAYVKRALSLVGGY